MTEIEVRAVRPAELAAVAELRWRWVAEQDGLPGDGRAEFVREFALWAREHAATHHCLVVVRAGRVLGMAFLAVTPRVPTPAAFTRACGDVQSVYVVPEARREGLGGMLIEAVLRLAGELELERVTVHSSGPAVPAYERRGFAVAPQLLQVPVRRPRSVSPAGRRPSGGG
ncbi:GNAT family N-acetyltransferase [Amycolatopsis sp. NPDC049691]|uniref:GNAT family N-acetyltransferase n=1 Tax=Amycolatopsis sp. NPDC049691 TaxID=3155155 RepID=UPI003438BF31